MASSTSTFLSPPPLILSGFKPKPFHFLNTTNTNLFLSRNPSSGKSLYFYNLDHKIPRKRTNIWRNKATSGEVLPSETPSLDNSQEIVSSTAGDASSAIISILFFVAFLALSVLTIGVIYIGVTDFLQKREREKFEKEEASKKKGGKKMRAKDRAGPRGFGQKIEDED